LYLGGLEVKRLLISSVSGLLVMATGCASSSVKESGERQGQIGKEEKIDVRGSFGKQEIGFDSNQQAVLRDSDPVEDALRKLTWENREKERKYETSYEELVSCRSDLADPRLNGNKKVSIAPIEKRKNLKREKRLAISENGRIVVVATESLKEKLEQEQRWNDSLDVLVEQVADTVAECHRELGYKRQEAGLPPEKFKTEGYYDSEGRYIVTRRGEASLTDALKIQAKERGKKPPAREEEMRAPASNQESD